jgi:surface antigen
MKTKVVLFFVVFLSAIIALVIYASKNKVKMSSSTSSEIGTELDRFNNVAIYYNGSIGNVSNRNVTADGYNLGLKYQCVEFVKRYYYEVYQHKMPNSYGHAKDFVQRNLADGAKNKDRNLTQYSNPSKSKPQVGDLVVFDGNAFNTFGHVAIVCNVDENEIEIAQQNVGKSTRTHFSLNLQNNRWKLESSTCLGWLRQE